MDAFDDVPRDGRDEGIRDYQYGDEAQLATLKYNEEFQSTMCSLQQNPPSYQALHATGVDVIQTVEWANPNNGGMNGGDENNLKIDDMAMDIDFEESRVRIKIDFTQFLLNLYGLLGEGAASAATSSNALWVFDEEPYSDDPQDAYPTTASVKLSTKTLVAPAIDMNVFDHMWIKKAFALGINTEQVSSYNKAELLFLTEQKRRGETYTGRTAASIIGKLYPLYVENITKFRASRWTNKESPEKKLWLQTDDGRLMKRLSFGPRPDGFDSSFAALQSYVKLNNITVTEIFTIPLKWFGEQALAKIDTAFPERFTVGINATVGCYGDIVRFICAPAADSHNVADRTTLFDAAAVANVTDENNHPKYLAKTPAADTEPGGKIIAANTLTEKTYMPVGRGTNKHDLRGTSLLQGVIHNTKTAARSALKNAQSYQGEAATPVYEISQNPARFWSSTDLASNKTAFMNMYKQKIWAVADFVLKSKAPTARTKAIQSTYYTNGAGETTALRVDLTKIIRSAFPITVSPAAPVVGNFPFLPSGVWGTSSSQTDTADYYKIYIVEDSVASVDKLLSGLGTVTDISTFQRYFDEVVYNPWRTGTHALIGDSLEYKLTQTTGFREGVSNNRTGVVPLDSVDDWFYITTEFQANFEIPAQTIAGYQSRPETANHDIPMRAFLPCILITTQFDNSIKCLNNSVPSKPRTPHIISFNLVANKRLPNPSQPFVCNGDVQPPTIPVDGIQTPGAVGYRILISTATTITAILYADSSVVTNPSEELVN